MADMPTAEPKHDHYDTYGKVKCRNAVCLLGGSDCGGVDVNEAVRRTYTNGSGL